MALVLAPSDLGAWFAGGERGVAVVGGRLVGQRGSSLWLADAWHSIHVELLDAPELPLGALLELELEPSEGGYVARRLRETRAGAPPLEFERLQRRGRAHALRARHQATRALRDYFEGQGFVEVETPTFVPCPGLDAHVHSLAPVVRAGRVDHLITSPELHMKRLLVAGLPRIFQLARVFRAEELGRWHEPEFTLLEWYRAFADYEEVLDDTEQVVRAVALAVRGDARLELRDELGQPRSVTLDAPFERIRLDEAFREFARVDDVLGLLGDDETRYFELLSSDVERGLARLPRPVFLTHFPASQAALARRDPSDARWAERFELYVGGLELSNGFGELVDPVEQRARFELELSRRRQAGEPEYPLDERFLAALAEGLPRASGNALGLDRLLSLTLGGGGVADTLAFADAER